MARLQSDGLAAPHEWSVVSGSTSQKLHELRKLMIEHCIDIYIVPSEDEHQSEYPAESEKRREYISHFTGSAGLAIITADEAALSTDGRYYNQAEQQLDQNWELIRGGPLGKQSWRSWVAGRCKDGKSVGVDPKLVTATLALELDETIKSSGGRPLVAIDENLIDKIWGSEKPARPRDKIFVHDVRYAGRSFKDKLADIRQDIKDSNRAGLVVSSLMDLTWLFNLRGADVNYTPWFYAYALIRPHSVTLYIDDAKISNAVRDHLEGVEIRPYHAIYERLGSLNSESPSSSTALKFLVSNSCSWALVRALGGVDAVEQVITPIAKRQAVKNETELQGMRNCQIRDGAAVIKFLAWLEDELINNGTRLDELEAAEKLEEYRRQGELFAGISFETIAASGSNAAVIHYRPIAGHTKTVDPRDVFLLDSGGHYLDGTTDTTRTVHHTTPTDMERKCYTLVLKGHIALDSFVFTDQSSGFAIECIARQFLWREGLTYNHGTGHGVGCYDSVHQMATTSISPRQAHAGIPLQVGMCLSNEPGYYEDGQFGIRIENVMAVCKAQTRHHFPSYEFHTFEHLTMVPMCRRLVDRKLLTAEEIEWLNAYHREVWDRTRPLLKGDKRAISWLERETAPY